ncbi:hypothetical protein MHBO_003846 [Bonamia ostreae]|uniref:Uncharacterized protein n=1 Tax=Bonamia ostreae TaxID=126728 RepID=A0ABV2ARP9_9EUKA
MLKFIFSDQSFKICNGTLTYGVKCPEENSEPTKGPPEGYDNTTARMNEKNSANKSEYQKGPPEGYDNTTARMNEQEQESNKLIIIIISITISILVSIIIIIVMCMYWKKISLQRVLSYIRNLKCHHTNDPNNTITSTEGNGQEVNLLNQTNSSIPVDV